MRGGRLIKGFFVVLFAILFVVVVADVSWPDAEDGMDPVTNEEVSKTMFGDGETTAFSLVVFLIGVLLLVALLGGVFLAKEEKQ